MWGTVDSTRRVKCRVRSVPPCAPCHLVDCAAVPVAGPPTVDLRRSRPATAPTVPRRIGLFGGTFDPPHVGHLVTAVNVRHALDLDVVVLMVANVPWQKEGEPVDHAGRTTAWRWSRRRSPTCPGLEAGRLEIDHGGTSYTADTLAALAERDTRAPSCSRSSVTTPPPGCTRGSATRRSSPARRLVVVDRPGEPVELPDDVDWIRVEVPRLEVSSTDLRARFADGRPLDYLVTEPVLDVIAERGLYRRDA